MKILYYLLFVFLLIACASEENENSEDQPPMSEDEARALEEGNMIETFTTPMAELSGMGNQFITGRKWRDANGENVLIFSFSEEPEVDIDGEEGLSRSLYAEHFVKKQGASSFSILRKVQDSEKGCSLDNMLYLNDHSIRITDLDNDKLKEISFIYTFGCISDYSPYPMKLIMLENGEEYAIKGAIRLKTELATNGNGEIAKSESKHFDESFKNAPSAFKRYASELWDAHELQ